MLYIQTEYVNIRAGWLTGKMIEVHLSSALLFLALCPFIFLAPMNKISKKYVCTESEEAAKRLLFLKKIENILWIYYEYNDFADLEVELKNPLLIN